MPDNCPIRIIPVSSNSSRNPKVVYGEVLDYSSIGTVGTNSLIAKQRGLYSFVFRQIRQLSCCICGLWMRADHRPTTTKQRETKIVKSDNMAASSKAWAIVAGVGPGT